MPDPFLKSISIDGLQPIAAVKSEEYEMALFAVEGGELSSEAVFYVGVDERVDRSKDSSFINKMVGVGPYDPFPVGMFPYSHGMMRLYEISELLPSIVRDKYDKYDECVGPNCMQAALTADGYRRFKGRYVHLKEFNYYLRRDYEEVPADETLISGGLVTYASNLSERVVHAAYPIFGAYVFHKGGLSNVYPYEVVPQKWAADIHSGSRGDNKSYQKETSNYSTKTYRKKKKVLSDYVASTKRDRVYFQPLFEYYIEKLREISEVAFINTYIRINPFTMKNIRNLLDEFREDHDLDAVDILSINDIVAEEYLELESFYYNYVGQITLYNSKITLLSGNSDLGDPSLFYKDGDLNLMDDDVQKELSFRFRKVQEGTFPEMNDDFKEELRVHLRVRGVENEDVLEGVAEVFKNIFEMIEMKKITLRDGELIDFDYVSILERAIADIAEARTAHTSNFAGFLWDVDFQEIDWGDNDDVDSMGLGSELMVNPSLPFFPAAMMGSLTAVSKSIIP